MKYKVKNGLETSLTNEWLFQYVAPSIRRRCPNDTRLFACFDNEIPVPTVIRTRVREAYARLGLSETAPVEKVPLHVYRINEQLMIDEVPDELPTEGDGTTTPAAARAIPTSQTEAYRTMVVQINRLE